VAVLVITHEQDVGADYVMLELERRGVPVLRCNAERLPRWRVTLRPGQDWMLSDPYGRTASSESTSGVWWRRPERPSFDHHLSAGKRRALVDQWQAFAEGLASVSGPRWVSAPAAIGAAEDKARQIGTAREVGFAVPATVWTNDVERAHAVTAAGAAVVKTVTAAHWESDGEAAFVFAHSLTADDLPTDASNFAFAPAVLQTQITPKRDVRATVVGDRVLAAETHAKSGVDWRLEDGLDWRLHDLPPVIARRCRALVDALGLQFGGIDLALDRDGTYWFLEINPNGEWGWLQTAGLGIASALADLLTYGCEN